MMQLFSLIWFCLLIAALIGGLIAWLLLRNAITRERTAVETDWRGRLATEGGRVQSLTATQNEMSAKLQRLELNLSNETSALAALRATHDQSTTAATKKQSELDTQLAKLNADVSQATTTGNTHLTALSALRHEHTNLTNQHSGLNDEFAKAKQNHQALEAKFKDRDREATDLANQIAHCKQQVARVDQENSSLHKRLRELEALPATVAERDLRIRALETKQTDLVRLNGEFESGLKTRMAELDALRTDGARTTKIAQEQQAKLQAEANAMAAELAKLRQDNGRLTELEVTLRNNLAACQDKSKALDAALAECKRKLDHEEHEHRSFKGQLLTAQERMTAIESDSSKAKHAHAEELTKTRKGRADHQALINARELSLRAAEVARMDAVHQSEARTADVERLKRGNEALEVELAQLKSNVSHMEGEVAKSEARAHNYDDLLQRHQSTENLLGQTRSDVAQHESRVQELTGSVSALQVRARNYDELARIVRSHEQTIAARSTTISRQHVALEERDKTLSDWQARWRSYEELARIVRSQEAALARFRAPAPAAPALNEEAHMLAQRLRVTQAEFTATRDEYAAYRREVERNQSRPAPAAIQTAPAAALPKWGAKRPTQIDDLKLIWGVGPKLEKMLHDLGIYTFRQIASWDANDIEAVDAQLAVFHGRIIRDNWVASAKEEYLKKYNEKI